jgi:hypothetical protein
VVAGAGVAVMSAAICLSLLLAYLIGRADGRHVERFGAIRPLPAIHVVREPRLDIAAAMRRKSS